MSDQVNRLVRGLDPDRKMVWGSTITSDFAPNAAGACANA